MRAKATCTLHSMHLCSFAGPEIRSQSTGTVWKVLQNQTNRRWFLSYWSRWICFFHWHELLSTTLKSCTAVQHTDLVCGEHSCRFLQAIWGSQYQRGRCLLLWQLEPPAAGHVSVWEGCKGRFWLAETKGLLTPAFFPQKFKTGPNTKGTDPWDLTWLDASSPTETSCQLQQISSTVTLITGLYRKEFKSTCVVRFVTSSFQA